MKVLEFVMFGDCYTENMKVIEKEKNRFASVPFPSIIKVEKFCRLVVDVGRVARVECIVSREQMFVTDKEYLYQAWYSYLTNSLMQLLQKELNEQIVECKKQEK